MKTGHLAHSQFGTAEISVHDMSHAIRKGGDCVWRDTCYAMHMFIIITVRCAYNKVVAGYVMSLPFATHLS